MLFVHYVHLSSASLMTIIPNKKERGIMPLSEKKKASNAKWDAQNLKRLSLAVPVERYAEMKEHTQETGETINGFINRAIRETISRERE